MKRKNFLFFEIQEKWEEKTELKVDSLYRSVLWIFQSFFHLFLSVLVSFSAIFSLSLSVLYDIFFCLLSSTGFVVVVNAGSNNQIFFSSYLYSFLGYLDTQQQKKKCEKNYAPATATTTKILILFMNQNYFFFLFQYFIIIIVF